MLVYIIIHKCVLDDKSFCPDVPIGVTVYNIQSNDFRNVDLKQHPADVGFSTSVVITNSLDGSQSKVTRTLPKGSFSFKKAPRLTQLYVNGNYSLTDAQSPSTFELASRTELVNVNYGVTSLGIADFSSGSSALRSYVQTNARGGAINPLVNSARYLFNACSSLETLHFYGTNLGAVNFPVSFTNENLDYLDLRYTSIKGGAPGNETEVISSSTFATCPNVRYVMIDSGNLLQQGINVNAFKQNSKLYY